MIKTLPCLLCIAAISIAPLSAKPDNDPTDALLALERSAMDGWLKGDPGPQLRISDQQIVYIHQVVGVRIDGLPALKELYDAYRGTPLFDSYEIQNPKVQALGDVAILTYRLAQHRADATRYWNGTEVFHKNAEGWRIVHSHWSEAKSARQ